MPKNKIILTGGAGLVGQNLLHFLATSKQLELFVIDKNKNNLQIAKENKNKYDSKESDKK